ncbi:MULTISPECIES: creatininase family protein [unclassified Streptosporangium]|uniref:creatininase family protein n=1 Tax=unclassified Streptosporangium TaxID=2632669 RepID=UPI002DDBD8D3|nr:MULTISPECIES: creatininase family protein [unclassified Streptosporangium]
MTISCSHEHSTWPGTAGISARTLHAIVTDVHDSVTRSGPTALVVVNGHGGNYVLSNVVQEGNAEGRTMALFPLHGRWWNHLWLQMHPPCVRAPLRMPMSRGCAFRKCMLRRGTYYSRMVCTSHEKHD